MICCIVSAPWWVSEDALTARPLSSFDTKWSKNGEEFSEYLGGITFIVAECNQHERHPLSGMMGGEAKLHVEWAVHGPNLVVRVKGDLDLMTAEPFRRTLDETLARTRVRNLYINLSGVTFLDSSGLGVLLGRYKRLRAAGGRMGLVAPSPAVQQVIDLAGLHKFMEIHDSEAAVAVG